MYPNVDRPPPLIGILNGPHSWTHAQSSAGPRQAASSSGTRRGLPAPPQLGPGSTPDRPQIGHRYSPERPWLPRRPRRDASMPALAAGRRPHRRRSRRRAGCQRPIAGRGRGLSPAPTSTLLLNSRGGVRPTGQGPKSTCKGCQNRTRINNAEHESRTRMNIHRVCLGGPLYR